MKKRIELLMPAGDLLRLKAAFLYGADAVFIGGKSFSLRAKASNFTMKDIKEGVEFAHAINKKVYVTVNIIPHCGDLKDIQIYLKQLDEIGVDAIIVSSLAIINLVKEMNLSLECHVSTQVSALNIEAVFFYENLGCTRVVLGRECSIDDISSIIKQCNAEIEVFIQGGLCSSYSGKCTLSNYFVSRDANRGGCAHSCRWDYSLSTNGQEIIMPGHFKIASKDLMGIRYVSDLIKSGVASLKVEGRMKSLNYVSLVAKAYRKVIDAVYNNTLNEELLISVEKELSKIESRPLCAAYLNPTGVSNLDQIYGNESRMVNQKYLGYIEKVDNDFVQISRKNDIKVGETIEVIGYDCDSFLVKVEKLWDKDGDVLIANKTENTLFAVLSKPVKEYYILRKNEN